MLKLSIYIGIHYKVMLYEINIDCNIFKILNYYQIAVQFGKNIVLLC